MRILQVTGSATGGVARHVRQVVEVLADAGPHTLVHAGPDVLADAGPGGSADAGSVTFADAGPHVRIAAPADVVASVPAPGAVLDLRDRPAPADVGTVRRLRRLARGADVVHAHGLRAGALAVLAVRTLPRRPRLVVTEHNLPVGGRKVLAVAGVLERVVARGADTVLAVAPDLAERVRGLGARDVRLAVIPAPPRRPATRSRAEVRAELDVPDGVALVVTVARLAPQKGLDLLLEAAGATEELLAGSTGSGGGSGPATSWCVCGDGPLAGEIAALAATYGVPVRLLGARDDVPDLLAAADVVVSTSAWDGQTIVLQEAMHVGAAVVATDVGGVFLVTGHAALLTGRHPGEVGSAVARVLTEPGLADRLRAGARERSGALATGADLRRQLMAVYSGAAH